MTAYIATIYIRVYSIEILIYALVCLVDLTNENCGFKLAGLRQIWLPTITETKTEIDFCKELKRPLMTVFGLEQLTLYRKTSLIICECQRALYGIKCVLRIFLTNMASHTDG